MAYILKSKKKINVKITKSIIYDIDVRNISCEELLYNQNPSAVVLSILCDFEGKDKQIVVNTILKRIRELTKDNDTEYKNYLEKVTILSTNRELEENVKKGAEMLAVDIENIPFYQDGKMVGIKEGIEKGIKEGIEKGMILVAKNMLKLNIDIDTICKSTGLSIDKIEEIKRELG